MEAGSLLETSGGGKDLGVKYFPLLLNGSCQRDVPTAQDEDELKYKSPLDQTSASLHVSQNSSSGQNMLLGRNFLTLSNCEKC